MRLWYLHGRLANLDSCHWFCGHERYRQIFAALAAWILLHGWSITMVVQGWCVRSFNPIVLFCLYLIKADSKFKLWSTCRNSAPNEAGKLEQMRRAKKNYVYVNVFFAVNCDIAKEAVGKCFLFKTLFLRFEVLEKTSFSDIWPRKVIETEINSSDRDLLSWSDSMKIWQTDYMIVLWTI